MFPYQMISRLGDCEIEKLARFNHKPPVLYELIDAYLNYDADEDDQVPVTELASEGRGLIFDFAYPLSSHVNRATFETNIINKFLTRRIGRTTFTDFKIALSVRMNEIMPYYNKLFDSLDGWDLFNDGYSLTRTVTNSATSQSTDSSNASNTSTSSNSSQSSGTDSASNTSDRRQSDTPENELSDIRDGKYVKVYNYDQNANLSTTASSASNSGTNNTTSTASGINNSSSAGSTSENLTKTPENKMAIYAEFLQNSQKIYTMIYRELESLFFQIPDGF